MAITSFNHKGLVELFNTGRSAKINRRHHEVIIMILDHLDAIVSLSDCRGVRGFHALKGNRRGSYAMTVSRNYRVTFKWSQPNVTDAGFEDYH